MLRKIELAESFLKKANEATHIADKFKCHYLYLLNDPDYKQNGQAIIDFYVEKQTQAQFPTEKAYLYLYIAHLLFALEEYPRAKLSFMRAMLLDREGNFFTLDEQKNLFEKYIKCDNQIHNLQIIGNDFISDPANKLLIIGHKTLTDAHQHIDNGHIQEGLRHMQVAIEIFTQAIRLQSYYAGAYFSRSNAWVAMYKSNNDTQYLLDAIADNTVAIWLIKTKKAVSFEFDSIELINQLPLYYQQRSLLSVYRSDLETANQDYNAAILNQNVNYKKYKKNFSRALCDRGDYLQSFESLAYYELAAQIIKESGIEDKAIEAPATIKFKAATAKYADEKEPAQNCDKEIFRILNQSNSFPEVKDKENLSHYLSQPASIKKVVNFLSEALEKEADLTVKMALTILNLLRKIYFSQGQTNLAQQTTLHIMQYDFNGDRFKESDTVDITNFFCSFEIATLQELGFVSDDSITLGKGLTAYNSKDYQAALRYVNMYIIKKPVHGAAYQLRADIYCATQKFELALQDLTVAIWLIQARRKNQDYFPDLFGAYKARAQIYLGLNKTTEARRDFNAALSLAPFSKVHETQTMLQQLDVTSVKIPTKSLPPRPKPDFSPSREELLRQQLSKNNKREQMLAKLEAARLQMADEAKLQLEEEYKKQLKLKEDMRLEEQKKLDMAEKDERRKQKNKNKAQKKKLKKEISKLNQIEMPPSVLQDTEAALDPADDSCDSSLTPPSASFSPESHSPPSDPSFTDEKSEAITDRKIALPTMAIKCLELLNTVKPEKKSYVVGGLVRDLLLETKYEPFSQIDVDVVTSLSPEDVASLPGMERSQYDLKLFKYGQVEIYCSDILAQGAPLKKDAYTRDFTINTLYANEKGEVLDPTGRGLNDLDTKDLVSVSSAKHSFKEDPLRMLRAVYLSSKLDRQFRNPDKIQKAVQENVFALLITKESLGKTNTWMRKLFCRGKAVKNFDLLLQLGILAQLFPPLASDDTAAEETWKNARSFCAFLDNDYVNKIPPKLYKLFNFFKEKVCGSENVLIKENERSYNEYLSKKMASNPYGFYPPVSPPLIPAMSAATVSTVSIAPK